MGESNQQKRHAWVWPVIALCAAVVLVLALLPSFVKPRSRAALNTCVANLKQIDGAKEQWALEHQRKTGAPVGFSDIIGTDSYLKNTPQCPGNGIYTVHAIGQPPTC